LLDEEEVNMANRIDDSHHAFKRAGKIGPGPKKRKLEQEQNWECKKGKNTSTEYVQICKYVGPNAKRRGKTVKVKRLKSKKKAYNKLYRKWAKKNTRLAAFQARPRKAGYRCRKTAVAKCR
jgi:hypothetical protein